MQGKGGYYEERQNYLVCHSSIMKSIPVAYTVL